MVKASLPMQGVCGFDPWLGELRSYMPRLKNQNIEPKTDLSLCSRDPGKWPSPEPEDFIFLIQTASQRP